MKPCHRSLFCPSHPRLRSLIARYILLFPCILPLAAASLRAADNTFEPLITQDADTRQGLTEFHSVNGVLNLQLAATYATDDADGPNMPANPVLGDPSQQTIYPRLAFYCQDATHQVTSFAGPLLRVHAGDRVHIQFTNALVTQRTNLHFHGLDVSPLAEDGSGAFGDFVGLPYVNSTAPGDTRVYDFKIPDNELGGPYWYHSHAHGVAEMQVACGLSGAFYVEGAVTALQRSLRERLQPLAASQNHATAASARQTLAEVESTLPQLPHHLLVLKDFWTPGYGPINGPLEQSVNGKITYETGVTGTAAGSPYVIQYGATDQIWDISNQSANLYYVLSFTGSNLGSTGFYLMARDGVPVGANLSFPPLDNALMIPPAGRVTVIVPTGPLNGGSVNVTAQTVNTLGDDYFQVGNQVNQRPAPWNLITMTPAAATAPQGVTPWPQLADALQTELQATKSNWMQNFDASHQVDASYVLAEPPNPSNGYLPPEPAQFSLYRLSDGAHIYPKGPADAYDNYEPPIARLIPDQPQRWIIQNTTGEWHAFHLHQAHFRVERYTVVNDLVNPLNNQDPPADNEGNPFYATNEPPPAGSGQAVGEPFYSGPVDTVSIPDGTQVWLTLPLNEGPQIAGEFVMHCHILEHEDGGMMGRIRVEPANTVVVRTELSNQDLKGGRHDAR